MQSEVCVCLRPNEQIVNTVTKIVTGEMDRLVSCN